MTSSFKGTSLLKLIKQKSFSGVLLDLDNTLYDYKVCHEYALAQSCKLWQRETGESYKFFLDHYKLAQRVVKSQTLNQASSHSRLLYFQKMVESNFGVSRLELVSSLEKLYWQKFFVKMRLHPGAREFLLELKKRGIRVCFVTDLTASIQFSKLSKLKLGGLFDFIVTSEEAGAEKPSPKIFLLAQSKLGISKEKLLMIGDDKDKDELGAKKLGISFSYFNR